MSYLDELLALRRSAVERKKAVRSLDDLYAALRQRSPRRPFDAALRSGSPAIVAEFKRASPSAGPINGDADPAAVARAYELAGAAALSVLTEQERFGGSFADLRAARAATSLPVLCKDFVVDEYQIVEAAAESADAILLIAAAMGAETLAASISAAQRVGLDAVVEVHDDAEAVTAVAAGAAIVGINNRDLRTFQVDVGTALRLRGSIPADVTVVAESGYTSRGELVECARAGVHAVLVGEALMRHADPGRALAALRGAS